MEREVDVAEEIIKVDLEKFSLFKYEIDIKSVNMNGKCVTKRPTLPKILQRTVNRCNLVKKLAIDIRDCFSDF